MEDEKSEVQEPDGMQAADDGMTVGLDLFKNRDASTPASAQAQDNPLIPSPVDAASAESVGSEPAPELESATTPAVPVERMPRTAKSHLSPNSSSSDSSASVQPVSASGRAKKPKARVPRARRMKLSVTKVDPWSVAKISLLLGIAFGIIQVVAVLVVYYVLNATGTFAAISSMVASVSTTGSVPLISLSTVASWATIVSVVEIILIVVLATIGTFLYNVVSALVGGVHVTLGDD